MHFVRAFCAAAAIGAVIQFHPAMAQEARVNVRGVITSFDGKVLAIKTRSGDVVVDVPEAAPVAATKAFSMADVKSGMTVGVTTIMRADGGRVAIDVRPISATAPQGLSNWDLAPDATMTNAVVERTVAGTDGSELTLNYKTGTVKALVVPETAMSQAVPGTRADLKPGETVFVFARKEAGENLVAARVQVSKDGVKPTQ